MNKSSIESEDSQSQYQPRDIETRTGETAPALRHLGAEILTVALILLSCIVMAIATHWLWPLPLGKGTRQLVVCSSIGMLMALPVLLSIWCTLGQQTWVIRIPLAIGTEFFLLSVYLGTISMTSLRPPGEVYWLFTGVMLAVTAAVQIPFWVLRIWGRVRIGRRLATFHSSESQFSIKQLLITTTVIAATIPILQWLISISEVKSGMPLPLAMICGFCSIFILVIGLLSMLTICVVFLRRLRSWCALLLLFAWVGIPIAILQPVLRILGGGISEQVDVGLNIAAFTCAHSVTLIIFLSLYYALGFRIQKTSQGVA